MYIVCSHSNEYTQMRFFFKGLKNEFEKAMVNESSVFDPLKFYCIWTYNGTANTVATY